MPERLLPLLTGTPQTGDALGQQLGVNRVTINTLAKRLTEEGIPLQITRAGYALAPGTPTPALLKVRGWVGQLGQSLRYHGTVDSTQDELRRWADHPTNPAPHGAVLVAERQTAGRGRRGRPWASPHGTLVFSVLLRCEEQALNLTVLSLLPLGTGVAVQRATRTGQLKWPNDLLTADRRKLAGILVEADLRGEEARRAIIGIGVNVTAAPPEAAHVSEFHPHINRADLLSDLLQELGQWLTAPAQDILHAWKASNLTLGQNVRIQTPQGPLEGTAQDLNENGSLIIHTPNGLHTISAGDVELIGDLNHLSHNQVTPGGPSP